MDCITGGSPCQDLSVAGKRAGLAGERSGLFMEQIRVIKEMRERDRNSGRSGRFIRPRYMVWENVPGTFSSNKGEDFRAVLEETVRVVDENAVIPEPPKEGWHKSGAIVGDGWSIAWRIHDAQYWGVPQRRKRLCLLADFGGGTAPEILFDAKLLRDAENPESYETVSDNRGESESKIQPEPESLSGDSESGIETGERTPGRIGDGATQTGRSIGIDAYNHSVSGDVAVTLNASSCDSPTHSGPSVLTGAISFQERAGKPGGGQGNTPPGRTRWSHIDIQ